MNVFVTGGTGYIGRALITALVARGHAVTALVRPGSMNRVPTGATSISGDPLDAATFEHCLRRDATLVHLVGTRHPGPSKANEFERIDLVSIKASVDAARRAGIAQLVYVSVAQPAPVMRAYVAARAAGEAAISGAMAWRCRPTRRTFVQSDLSARRHRANGRGVGARNRRTATYRHDPNRRRSGDS